MANESQIESGQSQEGELAVSSDSNFTPDQRRILGKAYRLILSWQPEPQVSDTPKKTGRITRKSANSAQQAERGA